MVKLDSHKKSTLHLMFGAQLTVRNMNGWVEEHRFAKSLKTPTGRPRQWRFDWCNPERMIAVEIEGGTAGGVWAWKKARSILGGSKQRATHDELWGTLQSITGAMGRHVSAQGFENDCIKYNAAAQLGWTVLRGTGAMVKNLALIEQVKAVIASRS
ncbi:MAG: hypothetical protein GY719_10045 [bacterium]|nr:hypothetical protein [bacterium]